MNMNIIWSIVRLGYPASICFFLMLAFVSANHTFSRELLLRFLHALVFSYLLLVIESFDYYLQETNGSIQLRQILGSISFIFRINAVGFCALIAQRKKIVVRNLLYILMIVNAIVSILNVWIPEMFIINPDQSWSLGPLFAVPCIIVAVMIGVYISASVGKFFVNLGESVVVFGIVLLSVVSCLLEIFLNFKLLLPTTFTLCVVFYFLCMSIQIYSRDSLTGVLDRRIFELDLNRSRKRNRYVAIFDINNLKQINDAHGHGAGDQVICCCARMLEMTFFQHAKIYRLGGDEFVAIIRSMDEENLERLMHSFESKFKRRGFSAAWGYCYVTPGASLASFMEVADRRMYECKRRQKENM